MVKNKENKEKDDFDSIEKPKYPAFTTVIIEDEKKN